MAHASSREKSEATARPPEWWTSANTLAWTIEVWGKPEDWDATMRAWGNKMQGADRASAACYRPLTVKELVEMRAKDPRPANPCYYDGTPILTYKPLTIKRGKKAA